MGDVDFGALGEVPHSRLMGAGCNRMQLLDACCAAWPGAAGIHSGQQPELVGVACSFSLPILLVVRGSQKTRQVNALSMVILGPHSQIYSLVGILVARKS